MKSVSELYKRHAGADIYVVGTGTSMRVFPTEFLKDKITIGLNMAWKLTPVTYSLTIHPDLNMPLYLRDGSIQDKSIWITKLDKLQDAQKKFPLTEDEYQAIVSNSYFFDSYGRPNTQPPHEPSDSGRVLDWVLSPTADKLYLWSSISQTAMNLAANMGAKNVILLGCDNRDLHGNHHAHSQHTRWKSVSPSYRYQQYYQGLSEVRTALRSRNVNVFSCNPFLGLGHIEDDFLLLCKELGRDNLISSHDVSGPAVRESIKKKFIRNFWKLLYSG